MKSKYATLQDRMSALVVEQSSTVTLPIAFLNFRAFSLNSFPLKGTVEALMQHHYNEKVNPNMRSPPIGSSLEIAVTDGAEIPDDPNLPTLEKLNCDAYLLAFLM